MGHWKDYLLAFIPIFVAIDVIGGLPIFLALTQRLTHEERGRIVRQSVFTALSIALGFLFVGKLVFSVLGVGVYDFQVAGGLILLVFAIHDLLYGHKPPGSSALDNIGIVPLGTPLLVGPAVLSAILLCVDSYGYVPTTVSIVLNMLIVWAVFRHSTRISGLVGEGGCLAFAKVASVLLGAIAVMLIRKGVMAMIGLAAT
ncbi:MAG: MarC family protein, partial [Planctomycetes bacterium]|nr:MarC family protein [Planctomycetota bacterium]